MIIDFRKQTKVPDLTVKTEKDAERVETLKYLGVVLDDKLIWRQNTDSWFILIQEAANFQCS